MTKAVRRVVPFPSNDLVPTSDTELNQRFSIYLAHTAAKAVHEARAAGRPFNLSEAAARGIMQALNGASGGAEHLDHDQLDRIEKLVAELHQGQPEQLHQHQADRGNWTTADWLREDWTKAVAVLATAWLLCVYLPA
jgi:hypothetical protein